MAFKSSKGRDAGKEIETWQSSRDILGVNAGGDGGGSGSPGIVATGGDKTIEDGIAYHHFTSPGTFTINSFNPNPRSYEFINVLIVGGGGGGNYGGGGAGGYRFETLVPVTNSYSVPVSIGDGGAAATNGSASSFGPLTAPGGGRGGSNTPGSPGGSGGGAGVKERETLIGGTGTEYGNSGGPANSGSSTSGGGGGGGGADAPGGAGTYANPGNNNGGDGGAGKNFYLIPSDFGDNGYFAGGGGGFGSDPGRYGSGGVGGGGDGGRPGTPAGAGTANTGGGGGGGLGGAAGGSGTVVVFYRV